MNRQTIALQHLQTHGPAKSRPLANAMNIDHRNLAYYMTPLVEEGAVTKATEGKWGASIYSITAAGAALLARERADRPRFDPADPFGLLAKLHAARTVHASHRSQS